MNWWIKDSLYYPFHFSVHLKIFTIKSCDGGCSVWTGKVTVQQQVWSCKTPNQCTRGARRTGFPLASESSLKIWCTGWRSGGTAVSGYAKGQWHQRTLAPSKNHKYEWKIEDGSWNNRTQGWKISTEIQKALEDWALSFLTHKYFGPILFCL